MDRHTVAGTEAFVASSDDEYLENNCVDDPVKLCDFQLLENRIMKTVDSVYQVFIDKVFLHHFHYHSILRSTTRKLNDLFSLKMYILYNEMRRKYYDKLFYSFDKPFELSFHMT